MKVVRTHYIDTSALVKLFVQEDGSKKLRDYFSKHTVFHTTSLCFAEALGVLKAKKVRKLISNDAYLNASEELCISAFGGSIEIDEISIATPQAFRESQRIAGKYSLDLIDSFQIYSLKEGMLSVLAADSRPILITADKDLANAAKSEGLRSWGILNEDAP
jgi:predicted nucleic acid-binding protein